MLNETSLVLNQWRHDVSRWATNDLLCSSTALDKALLLRPSPTCHDSPARNLSTNVSLTARALFCVNGLSNLSKCVFCLYWSWWTGAYDGDKREEDTNMHTRGGLEAKSGNGDEIQSLWNTLTKRSIKPKEGHFAHVPLTQWFEIIPVINKLHVLTSRRAWNGEADKFHYVVENIE